MVVSTATIALQRQLVDRDLPRLAEALAPLLGRTSPSSRSSRAAATTCAVTRLSAGWPDDEQDQLFDPPRGDRDWAHGPAHPGLGERDRDRRPRRAGPRRQRAGVAAVLGERQGVPGRARAARAAPECFAELARARAGRGRRRRHQPRPARHRRDGGLPGPARARRGRGGRGPRAGRPGHLGGHRRAVARPWSSLAARRVGGSIEQPTCRPAQGVGRGPQGPARRRARRAGWTTLPQALGHDARRWSATRRTAASPRSAPEAATRTTPRARARARRPSPPWRDRTTPPHGMLEAFGQRRDIDRADVVWLDKPFTERRPAPRCTSRRSASAGCCATRSSATAP